MNFIIDFSVSSKNDMGILMGITLNLYIAFGSVAIFIIQILPVSEYERSFQLLVSSSNSILKVL
jgi:hypothetical protein